VVFAALQHVAQSEAVQTWQERQAERLECTVAVTAGREDLLDAYCLGT
jgi:hypothetical protein